MRRQLVRTTAYAVIAAMLVVLLPLSVLGVWLVTQRPAAVETWLAQTPVDRSLQLLGDSGRPGLDPIPVTPVTGG